MIRRLLRSRGARKFVRNRLAMASLAVIGLYALLAIWIAGTNAINDLGKWLGLGSLDNRPIAGLFLTDRASVRVGAPHLAGFGLRDSPEHRAEQDSYMLTVVAQPAFDRIANLTGDSDISADEILREPAFAERGFADRPSQELIDIYHRIEASSASLEAVKTRVSLIDVINRSVEGVDRARAMIEAERDGKMDTLLELIAQSELPLAEAQKAIDSGDQSKIMDLLREELSLALENTSLAVQDYADTTGHDDPLGNADADAIFDASDAVYEASDDPLNAYDHAGLIVPLRDLADRAREALPGLIEEHLDETESLLRELFPLPTGIKGLIYRFKLMLGTDRHGRSITIRALYASKIAIQVGLIVGFIAVVFGSLLGAMAAFYGGWVDHAVNWLYSLFTSIPSLVLLVVLAFMFTDSPVEGTLIPLYVSFCVTFWIGPCRVVRGEAMKIKELEYVQAATAMGFGRFSILLRHIIPNTMHLMFINFSLLFVGAIKGEVILTFLGLGVKPPTPSWGIMIRQSASEVPNEFFWQIGAATFFMFVLVLAFNIVSDALQDAFDPKHQG